MLLGAAVGWLIKDRIQMVRDQGVTNAEVARLTAITDRNTSDLNKMQEILAAHDIASDHFQSEMQSQMGSMNSRLAWLCGRMGADETVSGL